MKCNSYSNCDNCNRDGVAVSKPPKYVKPPESEPTNYERVKLKNTQREDVGSL